VVKGLDVFREFFDGHEGQFVLIGGTAATLAMEHAGLNFRATKDLDIVLHVEALDAAFGARMWSFIERGGYEIREASASGKPILYRFRNPEIPLSRRCWSCSAAPLTAYGWRPTAI
jgi:hypothetical protein